MITERLEWREERALIHSRLWSHPPQQTECTSSFLHLTPIQAKIKTFITLFEKCKRIYGLKMMKSECKKGEPCNWRESVASTENFSLWGRGSWCNGRWIFVTVNVDIVDDFSLSHSTSASVSERSRLVHIQLYPRQNAIVKRDPSLTVSRFKRYLNDTGIAVFSNSYRKKNKHRYSVWTGIPPSSSPTFVAIL